MLREGATLFVLNKTILERIDVQESKQEVT